MKQRVPFYYNEFVCITSECKDNCCIGGWEIDIDDETYERYNNMTGELKHKILDSITQNEDEEYCFKLCDGKCPMLERILSVVIQPPYNIHLSYNKKISY